MIQWDEVNQVLVDYMGYPISRTEALEYRRLIALHLKKSPADLSSSARKIMKVQAPSMVEQTDFSEERFT